MLDLLKDFLLKALGYVAPFAVRRFYRPTKIENGIKIRIRGEGDGVTYNCGELPNVRIWLLITNLTPFSVEFDRIWGQLAYGSTIGEVSHLRKHTLPPAQEKEILIEAALNECQAEYIRRNHGKMDTTVLLGTYINCEIHSFELNREIKTNNVRHINCAP